jgi:hypothetical protein
MRALARGLLILCLLIGIGFAGQGLGFIPGSYMTGRSEWAAIGGTMAAGGVLGLWWLSRPRAS